MVAALGAPLAVAVVIGVTLGSLGLVVAAAVVVVEAAWVLSQRKLLLTGSAPARIDEHSRFVNIARGLANDVGVAAPRLFVSAAPGPNAMVAPGTVIVTADLLESYTRTELEAVVAHCLVRIRDGGLGWGLAAAAVGGAGGGGLPRVDRAVDARTAAITRYPPARASAIRKAKPATGRAAALWFVSNERSHASPDERAAELSDL